MPTSPLFAPVPGDLPEEWVEVLEARASVRIERIVSRGHSSPPGFWYDQDEHEWVALLRGEAELELLDPPERIRLRAGDFLRIPAHRRHRILWTSRETDCVWLAVFYR